MFRLTKDRIMLKQQPITFEDAVAEFRVAIHRNPASMIVLEFDTACVSWTLKEGLKYDTEQFKKMIEVQYGEFTPCWAIAEIIEILKEKDVELSVAGLRGRLNTLKEGIYHFNFKTRMITLQGLKKIIEIYVK